MTCREVDKLLDRFLDGELEARVMREVALHVTRCAACEHSLQRLERAQDAVADSFAEAVAEVDFVSFWPAIVARIGDARRPWSNLAAVGERLRALGADPRVALTAAAGLALLLTLVWRGAAALDGSPPAVVNNQVRIDSLTTSAQSVALLSEPGSNTTVIWVVDDGSGP